MSTLFRLPKAVAVTDAGRPYPGAKAYFYLTGTTTPADTYEDAELTTPHANPVVANSAGVFPAIYLDPSVYYKLTLRRSDETLIYTVDPVSDVLTAATLGAILYPRTAIEVSASLTPDNYQYPPGDLRRYGVVFDGDGAGGGTDNADALNDLFAAIRSSDDRFHKLTAPAGVARVDSSVLVNYPIDLQGERSRNPEQGTVFDFTNMASGGAIVIGDGTLTIVGPSVADICLVGQKNANTRGFIVNDSESAVTSVSRGFFRNVQVREFGTGMFSRYTWTHVFENFEAYDCSVAWEARSNTNIVHVGFRATNCGQIGFWQSCEGLEFDSPLWQNITEDSTYALWLRQSAVTLINPYLENIDAPQTIMIGGPGDAIGCTFQSYGGVWHGSHTVFYREALRHVIDIRGARVVVGSGRVKLRTLESSGYWALGVPPQLENEGDDVVALQGEIVADYWWNTRLNSFANPDSYQWHADRYAVLSHASSMTATWAGLTAGEPYTLIVCMRAGDPASSVSWRWRDGSNNIVSTLSATGVLCDNGEPFEVRYVPFDAVDVTMQLLFGNGPWDFKMLRLVKGHVFPRIDIHAEPAGPMVPFTVAGVPNAADFARSMIYVSNESGGATPAFSDGSAWRRLSDRAVVS